MTEPPACVGTYAPDETECNGSEADPYPCTWRDRCGALQTYLRRAKQSPTKWLSLEGWELRRWCDQWVEAYEIEAGRPKVQDLIPSGVSKGDLRAAFDRLLAYVLNHTDRDVARGRLALPGELYLVDRFPQNRYVTIYGRARQGHDQPFLRLQLKPRAGMLELRTPLDPVEALGAFGLAAEAVTSGKFRSRVLIKGEWADTVGPVLVSLAKVGKISLPAKVRK